MEQLKQLLKDAGIVGAGGAGFPSYAKLSEGADLLVINGAECEPLLYTDLLILQTSLDRVVYGAEIILSKTNIKKAILGIKEHTAARLGLTDGDEIGHGVEVRVLDNVYPLGDEIALIYETTKRLVKPGNLPITEGVIVYNVETVYNIANAISQNAPVTTKWVTVGGAVANPTVIKVPIGSKVGDIFKALSINIGENETVIDGGPSMGKIINYRTASIKKNTKALLVLPNDIEAVRTKKLNTVTVSARAATACCQCTRCTDMCPRNLLGYPLEPHKMVRTAMGAVEAAPIMVLSATLCCSCGVCETLACPQGISPRAVIAEYKQLLAKNKMKFVKNTASVKTERNYRRVSTDRWKRMLGVSKLDKVATRVESLELSRVEILLSQHIGAPSVPVVNTGDRVKRGELIARAADGLSLPQHASIDGVVTVHGDKIIIEKVN